MEINDAPSLKLAILKLEHKRLMEENELKYEWNNFKKSLLPLNIVKDSLSSLVSSPIIKNSFLNTSVGLLTGSVAKKLLPAGKWPPFKKLMQVGIQLAVTNLTIKNANKIKAIGQAIFKNIIGKRNHQREA